VVEKVILISPNPIIVLDPDGNVVLWNPAAEKLFGWSSAEVLGKPHPIIPSKDRAAFLERHRRALEGDVMLNAETQALCKDGTLRPVSRSTAVLRDGSDRPLGVLGVFVDLTERKKVDERLRLLASALRSVSEGVSITDMEERIIFVNDAFLRMYGFDEYEILGQHVDVLRGPQQESLVPQILAGTLAGG
jgi:PAS domain S-box-containing protein